MMSSIPGDTPIHVTDTPIHVALVNTVDAVHRHVAGMLEPYAPRIRLAPLPDIGAATGIALFDIHVGDQPLQQVRALVDDRCAAHVALFSNSTSPFLVDAARAVGASAVLAKGCEPAALVSALEQIAIGRPVGLVHPPADDAAVLTLTGREHDVLLLLGMGLSNQEIGRELFLGVETIRTHVRQILRKLGVANRTQAALRATEVSLDEARVGADEHSDTILAARVPPHRLDP